MRGSWENGLRDGGRQALESALPAVLRSRRWFGGKAQPVRSTSVIETIRLPRNEGPPGLIALVRVDYHSGSSETYVVPLCFVPEERARALRTERPQAILARVELETPRGVEAGVLIDGLESEEVAAALLESIRRRRRIGGEQGTLVATRGRAFAAVRGRGEIPLAARVLRGEQSNTTIVYGERLVLKVYRRLGEGTNPDLEIGRFLTDRAGFEHTPQVVGALEYRAGRAASQTLGVLQGYVANEGDAWGYTLDQVEQFFERVLEPRDAPHEISIPTGTPLALVERLRREHRAAAGPAERVVDLYLRCRYGGEALGESEQREMREALDVARRMLRARA